MAITRKEAEVLRIRSRVLRLVRGYIAVEADKNNALLSDGKGMMTRKELLNHIDSALALKARKR